MVEFLAVGVSCKSLITCDIPSSKEGSSIDTPVSSPDQCIILEVILLSIIFLLMAPKHNLSQLCIPLKPKHCESTWRVADKLAEIFLLHKSYFEGLWETLPLNPCAQCHLDAGWLLLPQLVERSGMWCPCLEVGWFCGELIWKWGCTDLEIRKPG